MTLSRSCVDLLAELRAFVRDEQAANEQHMLESWRRPLEGKLRSGWSQGFSRLERTQQPTARWVYLDESESRYREGDMLRLHGGPRSSARPVRSAFPWR